MQWKLLTSLQLVALRHTGVQQAVTGLVRLTDECVVVVA